MKARHNIIICALIIYNLSTTAYATEQKQPDTMFLQEIQDQLNKVSGLQDRAIIIHVSANRKSIIDMTPSSVSYSYGFLKRLENINQLVAAMAHITAHISLDYIPTPPVPADNKSKKRSTKDEILSAVRPEYPDRSNMPEATGVFHHKGAEIIERPTYQNSDYDFAINKSDIVKAEQELTVDQATIRILQNGGLCPSDYSRMMHNIYENPKNLWVTNHFALDADQWSRLDKIDRAADPATICTSDQKTLTGKYAPAFDQLKAHILQIAPTKN